MERTWISRHGSCGCCDGFGRGPLRRRTPGGSDIDPKHQSDWEPTVAVDPDHANRIYQLITGINAKACQNCPGTSVLFRRSTDGGATFGRESFVCATACKTIGWQFDPRIRRSVQGRGRVHVHRR